MKIRTFLLIICGFNMCNQLHAQDVQMKDHLARVDMILKAPELVFQFDSTGYSEFKDFKFFTKNGDTGIFFFDSAKVHLIDFNHDGLKDVIIQERRLHNATFIFTNDGKNFHEIWAGPGSPVFIENDEETTVYMYSGDVGCIDIQLLFEVKIGSRNRIGEHLFSYHHQTEVQDLNQVFITRTVTGILRTTPAIDDTDTPDTCTGEMRKGNQIRAIENESVVVIKETSNWQMIIYTQLNNSIIAWVETN